MPKNETTAGKRYDEATHQWIDTPPAAETPAPAPEKPAKPAPTPSAKED